MTMRPLGLATDQPRTTPPAALPALRAGLAASGALTAAALLDELVLGSLETRVTRVYVPYGVSWQAAHAFLMASLLVLGGAGMVAWLVTSRAAARRRRWAAPVGTALFVLGLGVALALLTAQEYGQLLVPPWLGVLGSLPSAVGAVATAQLWRDRRRPADRPTLGGRR